ncbi:MAG: hypothetical protein ACRCS8_03570 [Brevinema sp.]
MDNRHFKQFFTLFFLAFTLLVALHIPVHAVLNSPLFEADLLKTLSLNETQFSVFRAKGLTLSNINDRSVITFASKEREESLYDLHLDFSEKDFLNNYRVVSSNYEAKKIGDKTFGKFVVKNEIILLPNRHSVLDTKSDSFQSFSIQFSLLPYTTGEGAQLIASYQGESSEDSRLEYGFTIFISKGIVSYRFINFFTDRNGKKYSFTLQENEPLHDNKLEDHALVVDMSKKVIKIYRNGKEQSVRVLTDDQTRLGEPLLHAFSTISDQTIPLIIGRNALFSLDYFSILKDVEHVAAPLHEEHEEHYFETDVITMSSNGAWLSSITPVFDQEKETIYRIAYRIADEYFLPETDAEKNPWIYIDSKKNVFPPSKKLGKYLQLRFEYFEQASERSFDNLKLQDIQASFIETPSPEVVQIREVIAGDQQIEISWDAVPESSVESYEIFYGTSPDYYFGSATVSPNSPINHSVKQKYPQKLTYTIEGVENNRPYYITIRAKNKYGVLGQFSREISSVPMSTKTELGYSIGR